MTKGEFFNILKVGLMEHFMDSVNDLNTMLNDAYTSNEEFTMKDLYQFTSLMEFFKNNCWDVFMEYTDLVNRGMKPELKS